LIRLFCNTRYPGAGWAFLEQALRPAGCRAPHGARDIADFCEQNTLHAPFARPGLSFHFAEAYARMGNREKTTYYLNQAVQSPGYSEWQYQNLVEKALADIDNYMAYWNSFGPKDSAFNKVYANQNYGCVMCHGR
jgi:hypothetical protein